MPERPPVAWFLLLSLAASKLLVHGLSNGPLAYGLMTDELYYLDCAKRLAWGYVDHPPLSIALLRLSILLFGTSELAIRTFAVVGTTAALVLSGLMAREMGGGRVAQGLAAGAALASPVHLSMGGFYSMNAIDIGLWAAAFWLLLRLENGGDRRLWLGVGLVVGLGLLNKLSMAWFAAGLAFGLLLTPQRRWLATPWPWLAAGIALLVFLPHLLWQHGHGWPSVEFLANASRDKRIVASSPLTFLGTQLFATGIPLWLLGAAHLAVSRDTKTYRHLFWIVLVVLLLLSASGSAKIYYPAPAYSVTFAAAGVVLERIGGLRHFRFAPRLVAGVLALSALAAAPFVVSLLPPERLVAYQHAFGIGGVTVDVTEQAVLQQGFAQMFHGQAVARAVSSAYAGLSDHDRERVVILTHQFGETGGINHYGRALGLPSAIGTQGTYWFWGPGEARGDVLLEVSDDEAALSARCSEWTRVAPIECQYCMPSLTRKWVYLCRGARLAEVWPSLKRYR